MQLSAQEVVELRLGAELLLRLFDGHVHHYSNDKDGSPWGRVTAGSVFVEAAVGGSFLEALGQLEVGGLALVLEQVLESSVLEDR